MSVSKKCILTHPHQESRRGECDCKDQRQTYYLVLLPIRDQSLHMTVFSKFHPDRLPSPPTGMAVALLKEVYITCEYAINEREFVSNPPNDFVIHIYPDIHFLEKCDHHASYAFFKLKNGEDRDFMVQAKQVGCPFTRTWNTILDQMGNSLLNYGLILVFPIVALSSWLSR
ncbi:DNA glycosylase superfamily protein [Striga asiatica]|uniref:DNA glycosylase superfamily protein n=1 Tax=Striga asiatica TaxID=4170 RepID=A0A5A7P8K4_STRAF|nr:DNA glycosylase superfamily protein [Striga asiatica]